MDDVWIEWMGGKCPVKGEVEIKLRNGFVLRGDAEPYTWVHDQCYERGYDIVAYRVVGEGAVEKPAPIASDGGSSDYYKLTIENEAGETIQCEMKDIIRCVYGDNFSLGNIAKAARRMYEASQGRGKEGASIAYDANKVRYFASEFERWNKGD